MLFKKHNKPIIKEKSSPAMSVVEKKDFKLTWLAVFQTILTLLVIVFLIVLHPTPKIGSKLFAIGCFIFIWIIILIKLWRNLFTRAIMLFLTVSFAFIFVSNSGKVDSEVIKNVYIEYLKSYEHTGYMKYGENRIGIDSIGLVKKPMTETLLYIGYTTKNMYYIREAISIWIEDNTNISGWLNEIDITLLNNGDVLVDNNSLEILIYLGDGQWIGINSDEKKVVTFTKNLEEFDASFKALRWSYFENA